MESNEINLNKKNKDAYNNNNNNNNNIFLALKVNTENDNIPEFRNPLYYESWIWEGDRSVLPYKWMELINSSNIQIDDLQSSANLDDYLKKNYYKNPSFDEKSFFFVTHRSHTAGCAYLDNNNILKFLIIGKNHKNKQIEHSLVTRAIKRAIEKANAQGIKYFEIKADMNLTNVDKSVFEVFGFK